jgi:hypothetical protein
MYRNTLRMATDHPVAGIGAGNWVVEYPKYTFPGDPAFDPDDFIPTNPWPSSDWVALLAERGPLALVAVLILGGALAVGAWRRWRQGSHTTEGLQALVALITLLVLACVSAFDAVLLLPAPTVFIAALLGALIRPPRRSLFTIQLSDMRRARLAGAVALLGTLLTIQSIGQIAAIAVFRGGRGRQPWSGLAGWTRGTTEFRCCWLTNGVTAVTATAPAPTRRLRAGCTPIIRRHGNCWRLCRKRRQSNGSLAPRDHHGVLPAARERDREFRRIAVLTVGRTHRHRASIELRRRGAGRIVVDVGSADYKGPALLIRCTRVPYPRRRSVEGPHTGRQRLIQGDRAGDSPP